MMLAGVGNSVGLAIVLTVVEAAGLCFIIAIGIPSWPQGEYLVMPHGLEGVWGATALIFFAYIGFDELGNFAEEMRTGRSAAMERSPAGGLTALPPSAMTVIDGLISMAQRRDIGRATRLPGSRASARPPPRTRSGHARGAW